MLDNKENEKYYITPSKMHGNKKFPMRCDFAFICYCPMPKIFKQYESMHQDIRYFVHSHPMHVMFCTNNSYNFVVVAEIYGGPMSVTTVEELHHYGVRKIIGIGFVGSFDPDLMIGDNLAAIHAMTESIPASAFYYQSDIMGIADVSDLFYERQNYHVFPMGLMSIDYGNDDVKIKHGKVWTTNGLYRETKKQVERAIRLDNNCVNMDTSLSLSTPSGRQLDTAWIHDGRCPAFFCTTSVSGQVFRTNLGQASVAAVRFRSTRAPLPLRPRLSHACGLPPDRLERRPDSSVGEALSSHHAGPDRRQRAALFARGDPALGAAARRGGARPHHWRRGVAAERDPGGAGVRGGPLHAGHRHRGDPRRVRGRHRRVGPARVAGHPLARGGPAPAGRPGPRGALAHPAGHR